MPISITVRALLLTALGVLLSAASAAMASRETGDRRLMKIFGPDDREAVADTTRFPWSAIGQVVAYYDLSVLRGTGVMISDRVVLTCAHVVRDAASGTPRSVVFIPGKNGASEPFGRFAVASVAIPPEWLASRDNRYDIALLDLGTSAGSLIGRFEAASRPVSFFEGRVLRMAGYPSDLGPDDRLYSAAGEVRRVDDGLVVHRIDGAHGQSGGPVWAEDGDGRPLVVAVYSGEVEEFIGSQLVDAYNIAVHISPGLCRWIGDVLRRTDPSAWTACGEESPPAMLSGGLCGFGAMEAVAGATFAWLLAGPAAGSGRRPARRIAPAARNAPGGAKPGRAVLIR